MKSSDAVLSMQLRQLQACRARDENQKWATPEELTAVYQNINSKPRWLTEGFSVACNCCGEQATEVFDYAGMSFCVGCVTSAAPDGTDVFSPYCWKCKGPAPSSGGCKLPDCGIRSVDSGKASP